MTVSSTPKEALSTSPMSLLMKTDSRGGITYYGSKLKKGLVSLMEDVICETKTQHDINCK